MLHDSFSISDLPPTSSDMDNKVTTLSFIPCAKSASANFVNALDNTYN